MWPVADTTMQSIFFCYKMIVDVFQAFGRFGFKSSKCSLKQINAHSSFSVSQENIHKELCGRPVAEKVN